MSKVSRSSELSFAFDERYYRRYYEDPATRVESQHDAARMGQFVASYLRYLHHPVREVLDLGCGLGQLRAVFERELPEARYTGVEHSEYLCGRYGWQQGSVATWKSRRRYDLVICKGVLQYLSRSEAEAALQNLAKLCRGALYLEALTREDWAEACDQRRTDGEVYLRPASFYRKRLAPAFTSCGGGLFLHERSQAVLYALETL
ncbi:MAG TPA: methyltransferase [Polyangiales bacterium]